MADIMIVKTTTGKTIRHFIVSQQYPQDLNTLGSNIIADLQSKGADCGDFDKVAVCSVDLVTDIPAAHALNDTNIDIVDGAVVVTPPA